MPWLGLSNVREYWAVAQLRELIPNLRFVHYYLNGADDVLTYKKWEWANGAERFLAVLLLHSVEPFIEPMEKSRAAMPTLLAKRAKPAIRFNRF